jgi:CMP-N,N'-diacetyllegionaminic acid synthase
MITAIIPAKGMSQRVPQKNCQLVGGESLVDRAITFARSIPEIDQVVVSTDSIDLVHASTHLSAFATEFETSKQNEVVKLSPNFMFHKRIEADAQPHSKTIDVVRSIHKNFDGLHQDLLLLQPTSPFRFISEFQVLLHMYQEYGADVFSAKKVESPHPLKCFEIDEDQLPVFTNTLIENLAKPAQQLPTFFAPDGAYYINSLQALLKTGQFVSKTSRILVRDSRFTINIDTPEDLLVAQSLASHFVDTN